ncbi:o-succinylbenzoate synthase [Nakamurella flava]|uniref:o-succinylbenzoate synthase n=1 Tax=Nakamurella flava TaxID=2576308 RepID=A0A4U6QEN9_9ACTN|nr:o-succinylbenzoate synthase [Nakamurella flava]TKV58580.1 o-succinylbenzoate synthase [Nakamurella flava]
MKITGVELRTVRMPLVSPFETSFGVQRERLAVLVRVVGTVSGAAAGGDRKGREVQGWGECVAMEAPLYNSEYAAGSLEVLRRYLVPLLFREVERTGGVTAENVESVLAPVVGHRMAKGALEMAVLDAQLRGSGTSFASYLGAVRDTVPSGVSVGIQPSVNALLDVVGEYVTQGYARVKLKIRPGWDVVPVEAVRNRFGDLLALQVDANAAYSLADVRTLARLDEFDLLLLEQPLARDDLRQHAELATRLRTPVCLDESITSVRAAADAIALRACRVVNIKAGRVGGYLTARRVHDLCLANGVPVWCGGMLETGLGRAANAALAALPGFTLPGDVSGSDRFYERDITEPIVMDDGQVAVPTGAGLGVEPIKDVLERFTVATEWVQAD